MKHLGLFEGIGGFSLAARWMGWETLAWCEWNEFGQKVLRHHFPEAEGFGDITKTDFTKYANRIDILTGGFPCQPYSAAGKRLGKEDDRHLWPEMLRVIREVQPSWVVGENVLGLVNWSGGLVFHEVQADLEAEGYEVFPFVLPACAVNAPHRRDRVWFVAYNNSIIRGAGRDVKPTEQPRYGESVLPITTKRITPKTNGNGLNGSNGQHEINTSEGGVNALCDFEQMGGDVADSTSTRPQARPESRSEQYRENGIEGRIVAMEGDGSDWQQKSHAYVGQGLPLCSSSGRISNWQNFPTQPPIRSGDDGLSARLDSITFPKWRNESIKAAGNAIVPQVAFQIFKAIQEYELLHSR
jgi:DNA (cytosine-5)-methyltransferase 1